MFKRESSFEFQSLPTEEEQARFNAPVDPSGGNPNNPFDQTVTTPNPEQLCRRCGFLLAAHGSDGCDGFILRGETVRFKISGRPTPVATLHDRRNCGHTRIL